MNRTPSYSRIAVFSAVWVLLTSPLSTYPLLQLLAKTGSAFARWMSTLPYGVIVAIEGFILIGPPILGVAFGALALRSIQGSWTPIGGAGYAKTGLALGVISALCAAGIFVTGLLAQ